MKMRINDSTEHRVRTERTEVTTDFHVEGDRLIKGFVFHNGGKVPAGKAFLALALKGLRVAPQVAEVCLNRTRLGPVNPRRKPHGWHTQVLAFSGDRLRDGYNELTIGGVAYGHGHPRLTVTVRLDTDI